MRRFRPIMLTAVAAVLSLIPIAQSAFWGPMAYAMMGGIAAATVLTLFVLPAAYAVGFRVRPDAEASAGSPQRDSTVAVAREAGAEPAKGEAEPEKVVAEVYRLAAE